ncbi:MAG: Uma2 family endonuclease [Myxococcota bacterium]
MEILFETEPPRSVSGEPGPFRKADYLALPEEPRCELLWGHLVVTPSPASRHQFVLLALSACLRDFALTHGHALLFAPMDVTLFEHSVLQPDLLLIDRSRREILEDRVEGPPDLVVEILSPSSVWRDRMVKLALYAKAGAPEYWIVDSEARTIELLALEGDSYRVVVAEGGRFSSRRFPALSLDLEALWDEIDRASTGRLPG